MIDLFFEIPLEASTKIEVPPTPIRPDGASGALPQASARQDAACSRPFCNDEWNSRIGSLEMAMLTSWTIAAITKS